MGGPAGRSPPVLIRIVDSNGIHRDRRVRRARRRARTQARWPRPRRRNTPDRSRRPNRAGQGARHPAVLPSRAVLDPDHVRRRMDRGGGRRRRRSSGRWRVGTRARRRIRIDAGAAAGECRRSCADCVRRRRAARADRPRLQSSSECPVVVCSEVRRLRSSPRCGRLRGSSWTPAAWMSRCGSWAFRRTRQWWRGKKPLPRDCRCRANWQHIRSRCSTSKIRSLWPPGPYALASAASRVVEGLLGRSRRRFSCFVALERGAVGDSGEFRPDVPLSRCRWSSGPEGVRRVLEPSLTRQERTLLENAIEM